MRALINYNLKKSYLLFFSAITIFYILSFPTLGSYNSDFIGNSNFTLIIFLLYSLAAFAPFYCILKDTIKFKAIYSIKSADISSFSLYFSYLIVGIWASIIVFVANYAITAAMSGAIHSLVFDTDYGILLLPINIYGAFAFIVTVFFMPMLMLHSALNFIESKIWGTLEIAFNLYITISFISVLINSNAYRNGATDKNNMIFAVVGFCLFAAYVLLLVVFSIKNFKKVGVEK